MSNREKVRSIRAVASAAMLAACVAVPAAAAAAATPVLRVSASRSATVVVTLPKVSLDWATLTISDSVPYAALYLEPLSRSVAADAGTGGFVADAMRVEKSPSLVVGLGSLDFAAGLGRGPRFAKKTAIPAGRYLVHVLTPKPVTLTLTIAGASRSIILTAAGPSRDQVSLRQIAPTPAADAPGAAYDRAALSQPPHAMTRTLSILRTVSTVQRSNTLLTGCRRQTATADSPPAPVVATSKSPACGPDDDGDGWAAYDASRRTYGYLPPVPLLIPEGAASTYVWAQYYETPKPPADQIAAVSSLDGIKDATAAAVVISLQR